MMQIFVRDFNGTTHLFHVASNESVCDFRKNVFVQFGISAENATGNIALCDQGHSFYLKSGDSMEQYDDRLQDGSVLEMKIALPGGIDFQHREGSKIGSGGQLSESQAALDRKERLRKLALETIDISKDPYFMRNHLGSFECKLCLTLHPNEGNYLAHTQGKRHQYNLGRRAAMEAKNAAPRAMVTRDTVKRTVIRIGKPGYKVTKSRDLHTKQRSITFEIEYPEADEGFQPRHRFMSAYEQKVEQANKNYQYVLFACDPYETIGFKIPNHPIDKREGRFFTNWDQENKVFVLQLFFMDTAAAVPVVPSGRSNNGEEEEEEYN